MGAVSLVDQDRPTWVFIFVTAMNDYVSNFPSKQKFFALQLQNINPSTLNSHPIPHYSCKQTKLLMTIGTPILPILLLIFYMVVKHKKLDRQKCVRQ